MATKKKLLQAAAGSAGGAGGLNVEQVFSTYLYDGNSDTQVIENGINLGQSNSGVSIFFPDGDGDYLATASLPQFTGAFTFEFWFYSYDSARAVYLIDKGVRDTNFSIQTNYLTDDQLFVKVAGTSFSYTTAGLDADGWNHIAVVRDSSDNVATFVNGTRRGSPTTASGSVTGGVYYIGSSSAGTSAAGYELMYGHMSSVRISDTARYSTSSTSITVPTSEYTSDSNTVLLLGQGNTPLADASSNSYSVTVNGNPRASEVGPFDAADAGEGGLVWAKQRTGTSSQHALFDTENGTLKALASSSTAALATEASVTSFNANGFSLGNFNNTSGQDYASWTFRKAPKFFDVVTYTGTGVARTVSHNLGSVPAMIIVKRTDSATSWNVYHRGLNGGTNPHQYGINLNTTGAEFASSGYWNNTAPTSTEFTVGTSGNANASGGTYVAYLFAHNDGDGDFGPTGDQDIIKCGSYTGGGTSDVSVNLGFEPAFLIVKRTDSSTYGNWYMFDSMRGWTQEDAQYLRPNTSDAEGSVKTDLVGQDSLELNSTGFTMKSQYNPVNQSGASYIYIAIRRGPMAVPTAATDVFNVHDEVGEPSTSPLYLGNTDVIDMVLSRNRYKAGGFNYATDRLRGSGTISYIDNGNAETSGLTYIEFDHNTNNYIPAGGYGNNSGGTSEDSVFWQWKRAPNYFDMVCYTGNGVAGRTVSHNLGVKPDMMVVKRRSNTEGWQVYHSSLGATKHLEMNWDFAATSSSNRWYSTEPTETEFTVNNIAHVNASGDTYFAYLFASLNGISKCGSFTTTGSDVSVDCGFSNGARFVLLKKTNASDNWWVWDTARGITAGADSRLNLNTTTAEATGADNIDPYSAGFTITSGILGGAGNEFIFYAIA